METEWLKIPLKNNLVNAFWIKEWNKILENTERD